MAIFSDDVDTVRIVGTILIFIFSIIGAGVPIVIARTWGAARDAPTADDDISKAEARRARREAAKAHQSRQTTLKFIQHMFLAIGAGVIVATAIMHMLPEGTEAVTEGYEGLQGTEEGHEEGHEGHAHVRGFAVADTNVTDDHANETDHDHDHDHENETNHDHDHDHENETDHDHDHDHDHENETDHDHDHDHENETDHDHDHSEDDAAAEAESGGHSHGFPYGYLFVLGGLIIMFIVESEMHRALEAYDHHEPAKVGDASKVVIESAAEAQYQRELSAARTHSAKAKLLELAVATHSVIIGVAFGALTNSKGSNPLALALMFHQLCEGFAVGAVFERAFRAPPVRPAAKGQEPVEPEAETFWSLYGRHIALVVFVLLFALSASSSALEWPREVPTPMPQDPCLPAAPSSASPEVYCCMSVALSSSVASSALTNIPMCPPTTTASPMKSRPPLLMAARAMSEPSRVLLCVTKKITTATTIMATAMATAAPPRRRATSSRRTPCLAAFALTFL